MIHCKHIITPECHRKFTQSETRTHYDITIVLSTNLEKYHKMRQKCYELISPRIFPHPPACSRMSQYVSVCANTVHFSQQPSNKTWLTDFQWSCIWRLFISEYPTLHIISFGKNVQLFSTHVRPFTKSLQWFSASFRPECSQFMLHCIRVDYQA